jgi:hypothetical protein
VVLADLLGDDHLRRRRLQGERRSPSVLDEAVELDDHAVLLDQEVDDRVERAVVDWSLSRRLNAHQPERLPESGLAR